MSVDASLVTILGPFSQGSYPEPVVDITSRITSPSVTVTLAPQVTQTVYFIEATLEITTGTEPPPPPPPPSEKGYTDITPDEAMLYLDPESCSYKPGAYLIDIRSEFERDYYGTPGDDGSGSYLFLDQANVHIPYEFRYYTNFVGIITEIESRRRYNPDFFAEFNRRFHKDDPLILICRTGGRTTEAAERLVARGFTNVFNVVHGISDSGGWINTGLPINNNPTDFYTFRCMSCSKGLPLLLGD